MWDICGGGVGGSRVRAAPGAASICPANAHVSAHERAQRRLCSTPTVPVFHFALLAHNGWTRMENEPNNGIKGRLGEEDATLWNVERSTFPPIMAAHNSAACVLFCAIRRNQSKSGTQTLNIDLETLFLSL